MILTFGFIRDNSTHMSVARDISQSGISLAARFFSSINKEPSYSSTWPTYNIRDNNSQRRKTINDNQSSNYGALPQYERNSRCYTKVHK